MVDELSFLYNDDEKIKYSRIEEKALIALNNFRAESVDFLDPFWQEMSISIAQKYDDLKAIFFGGMDNSENKYSGLLSMVYGFRRKGFYKHYLFRQSL